MLSKHHFFAKPSWVIGGNAFTPNSLPVPTNPTPEKLAYQAGLTNLNPLGLAHFSCGLIVKGTMEGYADLELNPNLKMWHPFNRQIYLGGRIMLPGHQSSCKGDRNAMHSSVETRYAFLDEQLWQYTAMLHPRW